MSGSGGSGLNDTVECGNDFNKEEAKILLGLRISISLISCVFVISMIGIIILFQKYKFFTQRLVLYLAITFLSSFIASALDFTSISAYTDQSALIYCQLSGFAQQITNWWLLMATLVLTIVMFIHVVPKINIDKYETLFVLLIFLLPLLFCWIPFTTSTYGPVVYFCWIGENYDENCNVKINGILYRIFLFYVPTVVIVVVILVLIVTTLIVVKKRKKTWQPDNSKNNVLIHSKLETEVRILLLLPIIIIISGVLGLLTGLGIIVINRLTELTYAFSIISIIGLKFQGVLITLVFTLDPETRKRFNREEIKKELKRILRAMSVKEMKEINVVQSYNIYKVQTEL